MLNYLQAEIYAFKQKGVFKLTSVHGEFIFKQKPVLTEIYLSK